MEKYFTFKYYCEIAGLIIGAVVLGIMVLMMIIAAASDAWEKMQKKKSEKYWKEHKDERT